jgi:DNA-binding NarL/FixJ family response regulator
MSSAVALVEDLMFLSRIQEAARRTGTSVQAVRDVAGLVAALGAGARLALIDLDSARLPWREALGALRGESALADVRVVGFFSHVHAQRARDALAAGATEALPRSAFVERLDALLRGE